MGKSAMTRVLNVALLTLTLVGCEKPAQIQERSSNAAITVDFLFEHDGCRIYRFYDNGYARYFARCGRSSVSVEQGHTTSTGKTTTYHPHSFVVSEQH